MMNLLYPINPRWATQFMFKQMKAILNDQPRRGKYGKHDHTVDVAVVAAGEGGVTEVLINE